MFELIADKLPELRRLEDRIEGLEQEHQNAQARVQGLAVRANEAAEDDMNREAQALNQGRKVPRPKEPELRSQLGDAERALEVLGRRLDLARADRAKYIAEHHDRLGRLLAEAQAAEGARVASRASEALDSLLAYFQAEDAVRAMVRLHPPVQPENSGAPQSSSVVWGNINRQTVTGGPRRGDLESALRYLQTLGEPTEVGDVDEGAA